MACHPRGGPTRQIHCDGTLAEGVKFHDGAAFNAAAVIGSFERRRDHGPILSYSLANVIGHAQQNGGALSDGGARPRSRCAPGALQPLLDAARVETGIGRDQRARRRAVGLECCRRERLQMLVMLVSLKNLPRQRVASA
jgi:hypothetical protein